MSDTKNRDIGRKREYKKHARYCDCWHCERGALKKKIKEERVAKKEWDPYKHGTGPLTGDY